MTGRAAVLALALLLGGCGTGAGSAGAAAGRDGGSGAEAGAATVPVTVTTSAGERRLVAEAARTPAEQERGLMFRTDLTGDSAMLFAPYPAEGGGPREAYFWMKNTPTPLDIVYIRADGTIARIAENTVPFSEAPIPSGEPVSAVLEIKGGRAAELGMAEGDRVSWPH